MAGMQTENIFCTTFGDALPTSTSRADLAFQFDFGGPSQKAGLASHKSTLGLDSGTQRSTVAARISGSNINRGLPPLLPSSLWQAG